MIEQRVAVFGSGAPRAGSPAYRQAQRLGGALAREGWVVVTGGYGGVMEAAARGAREAGGRTLGVLASAQRGTPNRWLDEQRDAVRLLPRLELLLELAQGYVWLDGSSGTLLELVAAWHLAAEPDQRQRPRVLLGARWRRLLPLLMRELNCTERPPFVLAEDLDQALRLLRDGITRLD